MRIHDIRYTKKMPLGACKIRYDTPNGSEELIAIQHLESGSAISITPQTMVDRFGVDRVMYYTIEAQVYFRHNNILAAILNELDKGLSRRVNIALTCGNGNTELFDYPGTNEINSDSRMTIFLNGWYYYSVETIEDVQHRTTLTIRSRSRRINSVQSNIVLTTTGTVQSGT